VQKENGRFAKRAHFVFRSQRLEKSVALR
jgi:hypothetical protein